MATDQPSGPGLSDLGGDGDPGGGPDAEPVERLRWRDRVRASAASRGIPLLTIVTTVAVAFAVLDLDALAILLLWVLRTIVLYITVAAFITVILSVPTRRLRRLGLPHGLAATVVFLGAIAVFFGLVYVFTAPLVNAITHFSREVPILLKQAEHGRGAISRALSKWHIERWVQKNAPKLSHDIIKSLKPAQAFSVGAEAISTLVALATIVVLSLFGLLEAPVLWRGTLGLFRPATAHRIGRVYGEVSRAVTGYVLGNWLTSLVAGIVVFVDLLALGVPFPFLQAFWVALVDLLPLVGGVLAGVPVVIIAFFHSVSAGVVTLIVFLAYQQIENHLLNPIIYSRTVRLSPLWVLLSVLIGAALGGRFDPGLGTFVGALMGIPLGSAVQVLVKEIRRGPNPVEQLAGGNSGQSLFPSGPAPPPTEETGFP